MAVEIPEKVINEVSGMVHKYVMIGNSIKIAQVRLAKSEKEGGPVCQL